MELNSLLFPAPSTSYGPEDFEGEFMYIPRYARYNKKTRQRMRKMAMAEEMKERKKEERWKKKISNEMQK